MKTILLTSFLAFLQFTSVSQEEKKERENLGQKWGRTFVQLNYFSDNHALFTEHEQFSIGGYQSYLAKRVGVSAQLTQNYYFSHSNQHGLFVKANLLHIGVLDPNYSGMFIGIPTPGIGAHFGLGEEISLEPYFDYRLHLISDGLTPKFRFGAGFIPGIRFSMKDIFVSTSMTWSKHYTNNPLSPFSSDRSVFWEFGIGIRF